MSMMEAGQFQRVAKALADPRRFEILEAIGAESEVACQRLRERLPVSQATVSHHLKELCTAGLVESRREGQCVYYRVSARTVRDYAVELRRRVPARRRG